MRDNPEPMLPTPYRVVQRQVETHDSVTLGLTPVAEQLPQFQPGQFTMLYGHGIGEIPVSISDEPYTRNGSLTQTIRAVGAVSRALHMRVSVRLSGCAARLALHGIWSPPKGMIC